MNEIAVNTSVSLVEWMDLDKSESKHRSRYNQIKFVSGTAVESDHAMN